MRQIVGVNERSYQCEDGSIARIKSVLVLTEDGFYYGYIAGSGSDKYVADYGDSMSFNEARMHFPTITEDEYFLK